MLLSLFMIPCFVYIFNLGENIWRFGIVGDSLRFDAIIWKIIIWLISCLASFIFIDLGFAAHI
jgi:hypothetical protein